MTGLSSNAFIQDGVSSAQGHDIRERDMDLWLPYGYRKKLKAKGT